MMADGITVDLGAATRAAAERWERLPASVHAIDAVAASMEGAGYLPDRGLATSIFLALRLSRPLLLEGEAGVGKTEVARVLATILETPLIRLQCYEGIDANQALYEWNYSRQLLHIRLAEASGRRLDDEERALFSEEFLVPRPLLASLRHEGPRPAVLLIDEIDRADDEFEAFLLEFLAEFAVTIPEFGTIRAKSAPVVIITSNRVRELHDALKRRCLYHWIDHPDFERALAIVRIRVPGISEHLARSVARAVQSLQRMDLYKQPGIAEMLDWAEALTVLGATDLDASTASATLGVVLKYQEDQVLVEPRLGDILVTDDGG